MGCDFPSDSELVDEINHIAPFKLDKLDCWWNIALVCIFDLISVIMKDCLAWR